ncbi:MAG: hypothetical protein M3488_12070 [Actinomycetota bacterium]|nr:hypothetical protein [Actinomycetota bacterium]
MGALLIDYHHPNLAAVHHLPSVEITNWRQVGRAARLSFLTHAFLGFGGKVLRIELGNGGHDPVQQLA